jgi:sugar phosphate isomerase/epimerase
MTPTIGRIVIYQLREADAEAINRRREDARRSMDAHRMNATGVMVHVGNSVAAGDTFPMIITRVWGSEPNSLVNGQVMLDGADLYWACSVGVGVEAGMWRWPERV